MSSLPMQRALFPLLYPFSKLYALMMSYRRKQYELGAKEQFSPKAPCVSVGNISWGGSGKTPVVSWLLEWADKYHYLPVVLTRGYKATPPRTPYLVTSKSTAAEAGDEPLMLAHAHRRAHIVVDPIRKRSGAWAQRSFRPEIVILDDGFQHLAVKRDINLVLLKPEDLTSEWDRVIPAGSWREDQSALSKADAFLIKADTLAPLKAVIQERLAKFGKPVFSFSLLPQYLVPVSAAAAEKFEAAKDNDTPVTLESYVLFNGVGEPEQVEETAKRFMGRAPYKHQRFADHHAYTESEIAEMGNLGLPLVCTPKDAVKVPEVLGIEVWTFVLRTKFGDSMYSKQSFSDWWQEQWESLRNGGSRKPAGKAPDVSTKGAEKNKPAKQTAPAAPKAPSKKASVASVPRPKLKHEK
ncbi:tetraacyldisaccharide 4'-kinase [Halodesulfovibrio spirochaetisodalis]|uniref:tetraacyldisaccharide 4'-kinase n=1 Tax=Halodesulfovibrio spirochaetisodalis TaxID=1560234 RepID=UPI00082B563F|nr:tetraacyldisaccharide 4'-kinase [Halodesulfovibrio spirochaetisodalis]